MEIGLGTIVLQANRDAILHYNTKQQLKNV